MCPVALRPALFGVAAGILASFPSTAQAEPGCERDSSHVRERVAVAGAFVIANAGLYEYFRRAWWSGEPANFHFGNDWETAYRNQDKAAHAFGGHVLTRAGADLLRAACVGDRKAAWWGAVHAVAFQLQIEVWDGTQSRLGFSVVDMVFNTAGAGFAVVQMHAPALRSLTPSISYARTEALKRAPEGGDFDATVDYAGQTYWLSLDVDQLLPSGARRFWPDLVRASVGRSITDWVDPETQRTHRAHVEIVLSLDLDASRLPGEHPAWKAVKRQLAHYHFPAPAIVLTPRVRAVGWYR